MNGAVFYGGIWLARNSEAYSIWEAAKSQKDSKQKSQLFKKLDYHLQGLELKEKELMNRYPSK